MIFGEGVAHDSEAANVSCASNEGQGDFGEGVANDSGQSDDSSSTPATYLPFSTCTKVIFTCVAHMCIIKRSQPLRLIPFVTITPLRSFIPKKTMHMFGMVDEQRQQISEN